jgi:thymidylate synthase (FAD)
MILVKPSFEILNVSGNLGLIELAGRTCYKSMDKATDVSAKGFVESLMRRGHESVIEHSSATVRIICDRGVTHEIVRHRLASYSQESTRYCNYSGGVTFVIPPWVNIEPGEYSADNNEFDHHDPHGRWAMAMLYSEEDYVTLLDCGWSPQQARSVLPNSLKTEIVMTANFREWRHFFSLRVSKAAHPQMRQIAMPLLTEFKERVPVIFDDLQEER